MRIRFRAKRVDNGEWVFGGYSYCEKDDTHYITVMGKDHISHIGFHQQVNPETLGQFTGRHDRNGKEIYEGDLLKINDKYIYKVVYSDMCTSFVLMKHIEYGWWFSGYLHECSNFLGNDQIEVIGNIYENKEEI